METMNNQLPLSGLQELRRGWRPLLACSVGIGLGLSPLPPFTAGLFATALHDEFGWSRGAILASIIFVTVSLVLLGPWMGRLVDTRGARPVAIVSTIGLGVSLIALAFVTSHIWTFYACWACMAVVALGTLPITYTRVINGWFNKARGFALGVALSTTGIVGALAPYFVRWIMAGYGWRWAYVGLAALPLCIALPILLLYLKEPTLSSDPSQVDDLNLEGYTVREACRTYRFWVLSLGALALGTTTGGLIPNLMPLLAEGGLTPAAAAKAFANLALAVIAGRLITGFLLDRLWAPLVGIVLVIPASVGLCLLNSSHIGFGTSVYAVAAIGMVAGAEFDLVAFMTSRYFGRRHFAAIYAIQYAVFGLGSGIAPAGFGALRDMLGSYHPLLLASAALFTLGGAVLLTLGRYPLGFAPAEVSPLSTTASVL